MSPDLARSTRRPAQVFGGEAGRQGRQAAEGASNCECLKRNTPWRLLKLNSEPRRRLWVAEPGAPPPSSQGAGPGSPDRAKGRLTDWPSGGSDLNDPGGLSTDKPTLWLGYCGLNVHDTPAGLLGGAVSPSGLSRSWEPPFRQKKPLKSNGDTTFSDEIH